jgi:putative endonuclease
MTERSRGTLYTGVAADLAARVHQHREGIGPDFCRRHGLSLLVSAERGESMIDCIAQEKRLKRWRREWKIALVEQANPDWHYLYPTLV